MTGYEFHVSTYRPGTDSTERCIFNCLRHCGFIEQCAQNLYSYLANLVGALMKTNPDLSLPFLFPFFTIPCQDALRPRCNQMQYPEARQFDSPAPDPAVAAQWTSWR